MRWLPNCFLDALYINKLIALFTLRSNYLRISICHAAVKKWPDWNNFTMCVIFVALEMRAFRRGSYISLSSSSEGNKALFLSNCLLNALSVILLSPLRPRPYSCHNFDANPVSSDPHWVRCSHPVLTSYSDSKLWA